MMTSVNQRFPSLDTNVLDVTGTDMVVGLHCLSLVSVFSTNNVNEKVYIGLWYRPPSNSGALDDLYSIFENLDISVFSSFILLGDFNIDFCNHHHPLFSKLSSFFTEFCTYAGRTSPYSL